MSEGPIIVREVDKGGWIVAALLAVLAVGVWLLGYRDASERDQERARRIYLEGQLESARLRGDWPSRPAGGGQ